MRRGREFFQARDRNNAINSQSRYVESSKWVLWCCVAAELSKDYGIRAGRLVCVSARHPGRRSVCGGGSRERFLAILSFQVEKGGLFSLISTEALSR